MRRDDDDIETQALDLQRTLTAAEALIHLRDATGTGFITGTRQESTFPGNTAALHAVMIPHHEIRQLENEVRGNTGLPPRYRGGSAANTIGAIRWLARAAATLPDHQARYIGSCLTRWQALKYALHGMPALPQWLPEFMGDGRKDPDCPYCGYHSLGVNDALGIVACIKPACPGQTPNGHRPYAQPAIDTHGNVTLHWTDGTTQTHDRTTRPGTGPLDPRRSRGVPAALRNPRPATSDLP